MLKALNYYIFYVAIGIAVFNTGLVLAGAHSLIGEVVAWVLVGWYAFQAHGYRSMYHEVKATVDMVEFIREMENKGANVTVNNSAENNDQEDK